MIEVLSCSNKLSSIPRESWWPRKSLVISGFCNMRDFNEMQEWEVGMGGSLSHSSFIGAFA